MRNVSLQGKIERRGGSNIKREGCVVGCDFCDHMLKVIWWIVQTTTFLHHIRYGFEKTRTVVTVGFWGACWTPVHARTYE